MSIIVVYVTCHVALSGIHHHHCNCRSLIYKTINGGQQWTMWVQWIPVCNIPFSNFKKQRVVLSLNACSQPLAFVPTMDVHLMHTCNPFAPHSPQNPKRCILAQRGWAHGTLSVFTLLLPRYCSSHTRELWSHCVGKHVILISIIEGSLFRNQTIKFPSCFAPRINLTLVETLLNPTLKLHSRTNKIK